MVKIIEEINKVINKIEENVSKEGLNQGEVKKLLNEIDDELGVIEESAEEVKEKQKKVISEKIGKLRDRIDSSLKLRWNRVKDILDEEIKSELNELKNEIIELEKPQEVIIKKGLSEPKDNVTISREEIEELNKWRKVFPKKTPEEVEEYLKGLAEEWIENKRKLEKIKERTDEVAKTTNSADMIKLSEEVSRMGIEYVEAGGKAGGPVLGIFGNLIGAGLGTFQGVTITGVRVYEDTLSTGASFTTHIADNAKDLIEEGMSSATEVTKSFFGIFKNKEKTLEERVKASENLIEHLEQELGDRDKRIEKKKWGN